MSIVATTNEEVELLNSLKDPDAKKPVGWSFEQSIIEPYFLGYIVNDPLPASSFGDFITGDLWTQDTDKWIASAVLGYYREFNAVPPQDILVSLLADKLKEATPTQLSRVQVRLTDVYSKYIPESATRQFLHAELTKMARAKIVANALKSSLDKMKSGEFNDEEMGTLMSKLNGLQTMGNPKVKRALTILDLASLPPIRWMVDKHFPAGGFVVAYGPFGSGKSFYTLDLALSIATGTPFMGHPVVQGPVCYVAAEGYHGIYKRIRAWMKARGVTNPPTNFALIPETFDMVSDPTAGTQLAELAKSVLGSYPQFIVLDTLARMFGAGDENSTKDMNQYVANVDAMKRLCGPEATACSVHHSGKDFAKGARGAVALGAACDSMFQISGSPGESVKVEVIKQKDAAPLASYLLKSEAIPLDGDNDGSIVLNFAGVAKDETEKDIQQTLDKQEYQLLIHLPEISGGDVTAANGITATRLEELTKWNKRQVYRVLDRLATKNKVQQVKFSKSNAAPVYYYREAILSGIV